MEDNSFEYFEKAVQGKWIKCHPSNLKNGDIVRMIDENGDEIEKHGSSKFCIVENPIVEGDIIIKILLEKIVYNA